MCFPLKHFPAHYNDRTSLTPAVISQFKVMKCVSGHGFAPDPAGGAYSAPRPSSWIRGGEGNKEGGEIERKEGKGKERGGEIEGRELKKGMGEGERGGRERGGTRTSLERN